MVDKNYIDECQLPQGEFSPSEFDTDLNTTAIIKMKPERFMDLERHLIRLRKRKNLLVDNHDFVPIRSTI